jgi:hypothetical protein
MNKMTNKLRQGRLKSTFKLMETSLSEGIESSNEWWQDYGKQWIDNFREALIKRRKIGHKWSFSDDELTALKQYYSANSLLYNCLSHDDCYVNIEVREKLERNAFLPIKSNMSVVN